MIELLAGALLAGIVSFGVMAWTRAHRRRMERLRFHRGQFFDLARRVLADAATDDGRLLQIRQMASDIDNARTFRALALGLKSHDSTVKSGRAAHAPDAPMPREWADMTFHYLVAISYTRGIRGFFLRAELLPFLDPSVGHRDLDIIEKRLHPVRLRPA